MGYVTVKFLGDEYQISETIYEFLCYEDILNPIRKKMLVEINIDLDRDAKLRWDADTMVSHVENTATKYRQIVIDSAELLVKNLLELGVYDVTVNDILKDVTSIDEITALERNVFSTLLEEARRFVDMKNAGLEKAYNYAARNITGSGIRFFTNSFSMLMVNAAVERSIILSQAKKADKEYEEAAKALSTQTIFALDKLYREVMIKEFYPSVLQILLDSDRNVRTAFLTELINHGKFDFESVQDYNMQKADEMLKNISQVSDKAGFLKQTFLVCPYTIDLYEACLKHDLLDLETFETAKGFGFAEELIEQIETTIKENINNRDKIAPLITLLSSYRGTDETEIWKKIYNRTIRDIKNTYKLFNDALANKRILDKFIRENINDTMVEVIKKSRESVNFKIDKKMSIISRKQYDEFIKLGILSPNDIRKSGSSATTLDDINNEFRKSLADSIMEYIEEAKQRLDIYNKAKEKFEIELNQRKNELSALQSEKSKLGLFAFSKKKELSAIIETKQKVNMPPT